MEKEKGDKMSGTMAQPKVLDILNESMENIFSSFFFLGSKM